MRTMMRTFCVLHQGMAKRVSVANMPKRARGAKGSIMMATSDDDELVGLNVVGFTGVH